MAVRLIERPFLIAALFCAFVFYSKIVKIPPRNPFSSVFQTEKISGLSGTLISSPQISSSGKSYMAKMAVTSVRGTLSGACDLPSFSAARGNVNIILPSDMTEVYFPGKIYSSVKALNKGCFLYESGADYDFEGHFISPDTFLVKSSSDCRWKSGIFGKIDKIRALCRLQFKRLMYFWKEGGGLVLALLSGSKEYLDVELYSNFRRSGLSHIIALSGMHLSMFSAITVFFASRFGRKKLTIALRLSALICFVWFAGFSPSLMRAFICSMLLLSASVAGVREPDMLLILSFSFLLQTVISPSDLANAGFMLSYGALSGILLVGRGLTKFLTRFMPFYFAGSVSASCGAQIFTAPVSLKLFGTFSPIGIIATVFVSPIISIFIYTALFLIIFCLFFPSFASYSAIFIEIEYNLIKFAVRGFSHAPVWSIS